MKSSTRSITPAWPAASSESFGRLFNYDLRLYVSPCLGEDGTEQVTVENLKPLPHLKHLYAYLYDNGYIKGLQGIRPELLSIFSHEILAKIRAGQSDWEDSVPPVVATNDPRKASVRLWRTLLISGWHRAPLIIRHTGENRYDVRWEHWIRHSLE